jgi:hypothetical protein
LARVETAGGWCGGLTFRRGESMMLCSGGGKQQQPFWHHADNFDRST